MWCTELGHSGRQHCWSFAGFWSPQQPHQIATHMHSPLATGRYVAGEHTGRLAARFAQKHAVLWPRVLCACHGSQKLPFQRSFVLSFCSELAGMGLVFRARMQELRSVPGWLGRTRALISEVINRLGWLCVTEGPQERGRMAHDNCDDSQGKMVALGLCRPGFRRR